MSVIWANGRVEITASSYDELEVNAPVIEESFSMLDPLISENYFGSATDELEFYIPEISVWTDDKKWITAFEFRLIKRQTQWTKYSYRFHKAVE
jgi:hypothetical protein